MSLFSFLLGIASLLLCFLIIHKYKASMNNAKLPPGNFGWPIIGETIDFVHSHKNGKPRTFVVNRMKKYCQQVFKTSLIGEKTAVFCGPSGNKFVFSNENKLVKSWIPPNMQKILRLSMPTSNLRKVFVEFLQPEALKTYIHVMDYSARQHLEDDWAPNQTALEVYPLIKKFTFHLSCKLFVGIEAPTRVAKLLHQFGAVTTGLTSLPVDLPGMAFNTAVKAAEVLRGELREIINQQQNLFLAKKNYESESTPTILSALLLKTDDEGKFIGSQNEIANIVLAFLIASHDSTSSLITNLMYYLADNPRVYARVLTEHKEIAESKGAEQLLTWEDTNKMKYSQNVVNEVLRLAPPAQGTFREAIHDITYAGFNIPKGWKIFWSVNSTNRDPKYCPNPDKFDPTRFEGDGPAPFSFTPFGGGPRMCPGNEFSRQLVLVFLHNLVSRYKWEKLIPNEKIKFDTDPPVPENGLRIKLRPLI